MALFKPSPLLAAISGNVGGCNFAMTRHGPVIRKRANRIKRQTPAQLEARADFTRALSYWHDLAPHYKKAWRALAATYTQTNRLGTSHHLTPLQLYLKFVTHQLFSPPNPYSNPPAPSKTQPITALTLDFTAGGPANITFVPGVAAHPARQMIFAHRPFISSDRVTFNTYRFLGNDTSQDAARDWQTPLEAALGIPLVGERIGIRAFLFDDSYFRSPPFYAATTVHA